jgi:pimeloyl-ACP methyl ester carboxylesterase/DNA-binding winged helix-turn-helix (wHTH) protein
MMKMRTMTAYAFGPFRLEVRERRLLRDGTVVALAGKAFDALVMLVEGANALQKQDALMDRLWPDIAVEQNSLQQCVSLIRKALSDAPSVELETVRGQGYRLHAEVREVSSSSARAPRVSPHDGLTAQRTHFCSAHDGARLAYASLGDGPPLVKAANWLNHLELDWQGPVWKHWLELLSAEHRLIRYDARGNGLSDWKPPSISFEDFVADLGTVFDAAKVDRAPVLGISQGAAVAVAYAARYPERVSGLILIGGCARGWRVKQKAKLTQRMEALRVLMRQGWGSDNAAFRQIFTTSFFPTGTKEQTEWFNELQRQTTSPDNAADILSALGDLDVRDELARVRAPTLVVHSRIDAVVPFKDGLELASGIRGARFVALDDANHLLMDGEPGWIRFTAELSSFLREIEAA